MTYDEKVELVCQEYSLSLDLEIAVHRAQLTEQEYEKFINDQYAEERIRIITEDLHIELITKLKSLADSINESVKYKAVSDLGKMFYKKRFRDTVDNDSNKRVPTKIVLIGSDELD